MVNTYPIPLGIAAYLGWSGYRKGSLSLDGALTASAVGYASMANPFVGYGLTLITFYLAGSRATKYKAQLKAQLETHAHESSPKSTARDTSSGNRSAVQVLCNSFTAVAACIAFRALNGDAGKPDPLSRVTLAVLDVGIARCSVSNLALTLVVAGHYAACMGDTLASELGILSKSQPRLVTNPTRTVPKGTNGGISPLGLAVSALGGTFIGVVQSLSLAAHYGSTQSVAATVYLKLTALLTVAGFTGSLIDSLLGATLQQTLYNAETKSVLIGSAPHPQAASAWTRVTGADVLSNNAVNFIASAATALLTTYVGLKLF